MSQYDPQKGDALLNSILQKMNPSWSRLLIKLLLLQSLSAVFLLALCPQFGLRTFAHGSWSFFDVFMFFGHSVCSFLCGAFFIGGGIMSSYLFLSLDEWNKILKTPEVPIATLALSFLVFFNLAGAHIHAFHALIWVLGGLSIATLVLRPYRLYQLSTIRES